MEILAPDVLAQLEMSYSILEKILFVWPLSFFSENVEVVGVEAVVNVIVFVYDSADFVEGYLE